VRTVRVHEAPDTWFSISGRTSMYGVGVTGTVMEKDGEYTFTPYTQAKNYSRLPVQCQQQ
jgi:hypothetical protein